jgi:hypothetical protein
MPLIAREAVKGIQIGQATITGRSAKKLHWSRTVMAARDFGWGLGIVHDAISSISRYVGREHYRRVASSLIIGKTSRPGGAKML